MASEPVTLLKVLGKPTFQPEGRMLKQAEALITAHLSKRRDTKQFFPITVDDLSTLVEERTEQLDLYDDLGEYGQGIEGVTVFTPGRKPTVRITPELSETANQNRLKSTLAHELGHVFLHDPIFQTRNHKTLFDPAFRAHQVSYRDGDIAPSQSDLYEYQAWFFCRALLMPQHEVHRLVSGQRTEMGCLSDIWQDSELGHHVISLAARHFGVSEQLARIQLVKTRFLTATQPPVSLF